MKNIYRTMIALLLVAVMLPVMSVFVTAAGTASVKNVEVVLLFDVSGSMNQSDPVNDYGTRLSIEAAHQFVFNYPTEANMYITVVPYNSEIYTGFDKVNVATKEGLSKYVNYMGDILGANLDDIICWSRQTDIGGALEYAHSVIKKSTAEKKAVILFTDGKIELATDEAESESKTKAETVKNQLETENIPVYSIGLDCNDNVDRQLLYEISGEENTKIVKDAADLVGVFNEIYTYLFENSVIDPNEEKFTVEPENETQRSIRIYGQAVKEANIGISSRAALNTIRVETPSGVTVADIDLRAPERGNADNEYCIVNYSQSGCSATIKLLSPMDGDWKLYLSGEKSTVISRKLYLFDLAVKDTIGSDKIFVGDPLTYGATLYNNESNEHLTSSGLYSPDDGASAVAEVKKDGSGTATLYNGTLNSAKDGFDFKIDFSIPGTYTLKTTLRHSQFVISNEKTITVVGPTLGISADSVSADMMKIKVTFIDPLKNVTVKAPNYLSGKEIGIDVSLDGKSVGTLKADAANVGDAGFVVEYEPQTAGEYTFTASMQTDNGELKSESLKLSSDASTITVARDIDSKISKSSLSSAFETEIDLDGAFEDSDGDSLSYSASVSGDSPIKASVNGDTLTISSEDFGSGTVSITVTDGRGAIFTYDIQVTLKSLTPLLISLATAFGIIVVIAVVMFFVIRKKKIISIPFKVRLQSQNEDTYNESMAVYSVVRLSSRKIAKPKMTLRDILTINGLASLEDDPSMDEDEIKRFIGTYCANITMTGIPFKRAIKITYLDSSKKGAKKRVYKFTKTNVVIRTSSGADTVTIGSNNAEF